MSRLHISIFLTLTAPAFLLSSIPQLRLALGLRLRTATGHDGAGQVQDKSKPKEPNAAASLHTTPGDYARFVETILNEEGLKRRTFEEMERPQIAVDPACTNCTDHPPKELSKSLF